MCENFQQPWCQWCINHETCHDEEFIQMNNKPVEEV